MRGCSVAQNLTPMLEALGSTHPNHRFAEQLELYGRLVGSWRLEADFSFHDGKRLSAEGEAIFAWVLEGCAIQDLFIIPARHLREGDPEPWWRYGSTFRWHDRRPAHAASPSAPPRALPACMRRPVTLLRSAAPAPTGCARRGRRRPRP